MSEIQWFKTPFSAEYWRTAAGELRRLHMLVLAALMIAMRIVLSGARIPVGENLYIYISFLVTSVGAAIYGPVVAMIAAVICDFLSFFLSGSGGGPFFLGYTLSELLGGLIFALFLYRTRISVLKIASAMLYSKGYYYYLAKSIVKNALMLPVEILLMTLLLQVILPLAARSRLTAPQPTKKIPWI